MAAAAALREAAAAFVPFGPPATEAFAEAAGVALVLPAAHTAGVGFHEAGNPEALELTPLGRVIRNENRRKYPFPGESAGPDYLVMESRGRRRPATSAVDVAVPPARRVLAPVTGIVAEVSRYRLYGLYRDVKVSIIPVGRPDLRVTIIHLRAAPVHIGDRVVAGLSAIGEARDLPFRSQVNDYVGAGIPHVHIEVKRIGPSGHQAPR
jgi:hypothetical protein